MAYVNCMIPNEDRSEVLVAVRPTPELALAFMETLRFRLREHGADGVWDMIAVSDGEGDSYVWLHAT